MSGYCLALGWRRSLLLGVGLASCMRVDARRLTQKEAACKLGSKRPRARSPRHNITVVVPSPKRSSSVQDSLWWVLCTHGVLKLYGGCTCGAQTVWLVHSGCSRCMVGALWGAHASMCASPKTPVTSNDQSYCSSGGSDWSSCCWSSVSVAVGPLS